jgi:hypothetical protein
MTILISGSLIEMTAMQGVLELRLDKRRQTEARVSDLRMHVHHLIFSSSPSDAREIVFT